MNCYVINVNRLLVIQRFGDIVNAEDYLEHAPDCVIVENEQDIKDLLSVDEMVRLYCKITGADSCRFYNKTSGAQRLLKEMNRMDFENQHKVFTAEDKARCVFEMYFDDTLMSASAIQDLFCSVGVSANKASCLYNKFVHEHRGV